MNMQVYEVYPKSQKTILEKRRGELEEMLDSLYNDPERGSEWKSSLMSVIRELDLVKFKLDMGVS